MEDIYDDLDNYNDVNALQELRCENQILKQKLEECTAAMGKLQNDYDGLALEFKKLEMNYSSLLKTARAEIERKTQIITNLNIEKDMMVLKSLQNGNNVRRNFYKGKPYPNNVNNASKKQDNNKNNEDRQKNNDDLCERKAKDRSCLQPPEPVTVDPKEFSNRISSLGLVSTCSEKKSESKENVKREQNPAPKIVASSIRNRRKSMPAVCIQEIFSSDDECERKCPPKEKNKNYVPLNDKPERKPLERFPMDRHSNKTSESSSLDDRNSNHHEPPRETHRNRSNRYCDDKYRSRERYEFLQRHRRHNSPDRGHKRPPREYHDDNHHRSEHGRHRVLVSPPPDPYYRNNHTSNYDQRKSREHRPNYDRYPNEYDRHRNRHEEKQPYKHRLPNDHDEPSNKRRRIESFRTSGHLHSDEEERYTEIELIDRVPGLGHALDMQDTSCQSPDYLHTEAVSAHPVREIMNTAVIPLDDPRKFSNKYVLKTDADGATIISTLTGRNIDIIPIDKTAWNIERVDIPRALRDHPSQFSEELVHEIYMDVDNPVTNMSMESGEICSHSEELYSENVDKIKEIGNEKESFDLNKAMEENSKPSQPITINVENIQTSSSMKYRIPKIKHDKNTHEEKRRSAKNEVETHKSVSKSYEEDKNTLEYKSDTRIRDSMLERLINTHNKFNPNEGNENNESLSEVKNGFQSQMALLARMNVEGDLELSDENSDVELNRQPVIDKTEVQSSGNKSNRASVVQRNINENNTCQLPANENNTCQLIDAENFNNKDINPSSEKSKETDGIKHKGKKKKSKSKDSKKATDNAEIVQVSDKKTRSKKDKVKPKVIEKKFSDLFGDSGSLIMPEDLGIATLVPSFEDTQDAVDLNIKQMIENQSPNVNEVCDGKLQTPTVNEGNTNPPPKHHSIEINMESDCGKVHNEDTDINEIQLKRNYGRVSPEITANNVYGNLNPDTTVDNGNIVKTVVISTGVQPHIDLESNVEQVMDKPVVAFNPNVIAGENLAINEFKRRNHMKALATSTPHKEFGNLMETENGVIESSCSRAGSVDSIPSAVDQSEMNTLELNADVPDVRIFVRRRRKVIKKPSAI